jgi:hypothetical protein
LEDETGVSGKGIVAEGVEFTDGTVVLRWLSSIPSTAIHENIDRVVKIHGHSGRTRVIWRDD